MLKRFLSMCMAFVMAFTMISTAAFAGENVSPEAEILEFGDVPDVTTGGSYILEPIENEEISGNLYTMSEMSLASAAVTEGVYTIDVKGWHETNDAPSMMAALLAPQAELEVSEGKIYASIKFIKGSIMGIPVSGADISEVWAEQATKPVTGDIGTGTKGTVNEEESNTYKIELSTLDKPRLDMCVASMGNAIMTIRLNFDEESMTPVIVEPEEPQIEDGSYTIDVKGWHETNDAPSMMAALLAPQAELEVSEGKIYASIKFIKGSIMGIPVSGADISEVWAEQATKPVTGDIGTGTKGTVNQEEESNTYKIELSTLDKPRLDMCVASMGNAIMTIRLNFDEESMTPVIVEPEEPQIEDGSYTIDVKGWHETNDAPSMMASALAPKAQLEVNGGKYKISLDFIKTNIFGVPVTGESVKEIWAEPEGTLVVGTGIKGIVNESEQSQKYTFAISTLDLPILAMYVAEPMNSIQRIRLKFDESTLEKIEDVDPTDPEEPENPGEPDWEEQPKVEISAEDSKGAIKHEIIERIKLLNQTDLVSIALEAAQAVIPAKVFKEQLGKEQVVGIKLLKEEAKEADQAAVKAVLQVKEALVGAIDLNLITILEGDEEQKVHELGSKIKVILNLTDEQIQAISKAAEAKVQYYNPSTKALQDMNASFDIAGRTASFYTDHLSIYVITTTAKTQDNGSGGGGGGNPTEPELDPNNLEDGYYTIEARGLKESRDEASMCDELIWGRLALDVAGGDIEVTLLLKGTKYIPLKEVKEIKYRTSSGSYAETNWSYDDNSNTITAYFPVESITKAQMMQVSVPFAMELSPKFRLVFQLDTLEKGGSINNPSNAINDVEQYIITAKAEEGGKIDPAGEVKVTKGAEQTFKITADEGYKIKDVLVDDKSVGAVDSYRFENVEKAAKITAVFEKIEVLSSEQAAGSQEEIQTLFEDIKGHWAERVIQLVVHKGIFNGTGENTFSPNNSVTRGMFVTILSKFYGARTDYYEITSFKDVHKDKYYAGAVEWAVHQKIASGVEAGKFNPDNEITREQLAVMFVNYAKFAGVNLEEVNVGNKTAEELNESFADENEISTWAKSSVQLMKKSGIVGGKEDNKFDPKGTATRAEVAAIIARALEVF